MSQPADLLVRTARGQREVTVDAVIPPAAAEQAERASNAWIKALRHAQVDGLALRDRFLLRGDSLWWFAELYLHKRRVIARAMRALAALESVGADRPLAITVVPPDDVLSQVARAWGRTRGVTIEAPLPSARAARLGQAAKAAWHTATAVADRLRPATAAGRSRPPLVAAFVHSAFWRQGHGETYIGGVLDALAARAGQDDVHLVGVGPRTNFRVRRWADRVSEFHDPAARRLPLTPVEAYASWQHLRPSLALWRERGRIRRSLESSADIRAHAIVGGCDLWPLLSVELAGIADLQFPWSARAMDEAAAALDLLQPRVVVTYAEAGGWGRALMLEARRRGIPSIGLQHGFIYRHWLNYLHESDEMCASAANPADAGFPRPDLTLVFDELAAEHLVQQGRFPPAAVRVTGSPRLDAFAAAAARLGTDGRARLRAELGLGPSQHLVLVAAKHAQLGSAFAALVAAVAGRPDVLLLVKPHPGEDASAYRADAAGAANVTLAEPHADLGALTSIAQVLVTANSTAAIEAMVVDVPALVVALPNNLTPFVEAGAMEGTDVPGLDRALGRLLYDEGSRSRLAAGRRAFMDRYRIRADGAAAAHSAETILTMALAPAAAWQRAPRQPPAPA